MKLTGPSHTTPSNVILYQWKLWNWTTYNYYMTHINAKKLHLKNSTVLLKKKCQHALLESHEAYPLLMTMYTTNPFYAQNTLPRFSVSSFNTVIRLDWSPFLQRFEDRQWPTLLIPSEQIFGSLVLQFASHKLIFGDLPHLCFYVFIWYMVWYIYGLFAKTKGHQINKEIRTWGRFWCGAPSDCSTMKEVLNVQATNYQPDGSTPARQHTRS